jgi:hypothetical protein
MCERHGGNRPEVHLAGALEVALVVEPLDGFLRRVTAGEVVGELELADARVECLRRGGAQRLVLRAADGAKQAERQR